MKKKPIFYLLAFLLGVAAAVVSSHCTNYESETLKGAKFYFFYSDKCPHCQKVKPYIAEMAKSYDVVFCNLTEGEKSLSRECLEIVKQVRIPGVPTVIAVKDNRGYLFVGENEVLNLTKAVGVEVGE